MSRIDDLIAEHCPRGVEFRALGDIVRLNFGTRITKAGNAGSQYPVYGGGGESFRTDEFNREDEYVVSRFAMSKVCVRKVDGRFWMLDSGFTFDVLAADVHKDFVAQWLLNNQSAIYECSSQGAQKNLKTSDFLRFRIPVPPLAIQREIASILGKMERLEAELEAELDLRGRQYAFYRDDLLTFREAGAVQWVPMGEVGEFTRGRRFTKSDIVADGVPCINFGEIYTRYGAFAHEVFSRVRAELEPSLRFARTGDVVLTGVSETVEDICKAVAWLGEGDVAVHDDCFAYRHSLDPKFVSYYLQTEMFHAEKAKHVARAKVKRISSQSLAKLTIPVPPREEQERIVRILDRFDAMVNDLSIGLPAEIVARRKQYEYYRDKLLTFEEAA